VGRDQESARGEVALFQESEGQDQGWGWGKSREFVLLLSLIRVGSDRPLNLSLKNVNHQNIALKRYIFKLTRIQLFRYLHLKPEPALVSTNF
jgi:hypothetical protein